MNHLPRWIAFASIPVMLLLKQTATYAFTDDNAALKEAAADRAATVALATTHAPAAARPTAWVPVSAKSLDGFRPVFAEERLAATQRRATVLAQAAAPAPAPAPAPASAAGRR